MRDVFHDIETLDTEPGGVILSVGAVAVDRKTGAIHPNHFHMTVSLASSLRAGATIGTDTVRWWRDQSPEAQAVIWRSMTAGDDLALVLKAYGEWIGAVEARLDISEKRRVQVWGNGSDFDNILIAAACKQAGVPLPWGRFANRCFRTLKDEHRDLEPVREGVHHDALDDAIHQARWGCAIFDFQRRAFGMLRNWEAAFGELTHVGFDLARADKMRRVDPRDIWPDFKVAG